MREDVQSVREAGKAYAKLMAQPPADAKEEEETEQPETDLVESEEEIEQIEEVNEESEEQPDEVEESENPNIEEIEFEGAKYNVPKELKEAFLRQSDYTKKTQELAAKVQAETDTKVKEATVDLDKKRQGLIETTELLEQFIGKPSVSDEELKKMLDDGDTEGYLRVKQQEDQRITLISNLKAERVKVQKEQQDEANKRHEEYTKQQTEILLTKVPELKNEENRKGLIEYANSVGYSNDELKYAVDARSLEVLDKARRWDEMTKKGVKPKPKSKSPKVTKKASSTTPKSAKQNQTIKSRQDRFSKTNSTRDAGKLISALYANKQR